MVDPSYYIKPKNAETRIGAGGVILRNENDRLLICLLKSEGHEGYLLPKGGVEEGETLEQAARREISEETGITELKLIKQLGSVERLTSEKTHWGIWHFFLFTTTQKTGTQSLQSDENYTVQWFELENLPQFFWPEQQKLIQEKFNEIKLAFK